MASGGGQTKHNVRLCRIQKWEGNPSIGFTVEPSDKKSPNVIGMVESNSPAAATGLRIGDAVVEVNGKDVSGLDFKKFQSMVGESISKTNRIEMLVVEKQHYEAAKKEKLLKGKTAQILTTPPTIPADYANFPKNTPRTCEIRLESATEPFGFDLVQGPKDVGALVQHVTPNTPAARSGLRKSDRIIEVNDKYVADDSYLNIRQLIGECKKACAVKLYVMDTHTFQYFKENNLSLKSIDNRRDGGAGQDDGDDDDDDDGDDDDDDDDRQTTSSAVRPGPSVGQGLTGLPVGPRLNIRECTITRASATQSFGFSLTYIPKEYPILTVLREGGQLKNPTTVGLEDGDRLIEINGKAVLNITEDKAKTMIKAVVHPNPLILLVADDATVEHYSSIKQTINSRLPNIRRFPEPAAAAGTGKPASRKPGDHTVGALVQNPLSGDEQPLEHLYENPSGSSRPSIRPVAGQRTCLLRSSPDSSGMGFSLNNQEPDGTPHQIRTVAPNSPAAKSGLQVGDIVISINDQNVESQTRNQIIQTLKGALALEKNNGTPVKLVVRDSLPPRSVSISSSVTASRRPTQTDERDSVSVASLTPLPSNQRLYVLRSVPDYPGLGIGLNLTDPEGTPYRFTVVKPDSPAARENLRVGDILVSINGKNLEGVPRAEVKRLLQDAVDKEKTQRIPVKFGVINQAAVPPPRVDPEYPYGDQSTRTSSINSGRAKTPEEPKVQPGPNQRLVSLKLDPKSDTIGIEIDRRQRAGGPHRITAVKPLLSGADRGIRNGDVIVAINGKSVKNMSGDQVELELAYARQREKDGIPIEITIESRAPTPLASDSDEDEPIITTQPKPISDKPKPAEITVPSRSPSVAPSIPAPVHPTTTTFRPSTNIPNHSHGFESSGKYAVPKEEDPYSTMRDVMVRRDRTQVDLISGGQMYRVYHLHVKPGHTFGFEFETEGNKHFVRGIERGSDADKKGLTENDEIVEVNDDNVLGKPPKTVYNALRSASMNGYLVLVVNPRNVRALTKRSERSLSSSHILESKGKSSLSGSLGDLSSSTLHSHKNWNFEESPNRQLPDPTVDPTDPLPRACILVKDRSFSGCGFELVEQNKYDTPIVLKINPNSPARRSGLVEGDHIIYIDDRNVQTLKTFQEKINLIRRNFDRNNQVRIVALTAASYRVLHQRGGTLKPETFDYQGKKSAELRPRLSELILFEHEDDFGFLVYPNCSTYIKQIQAASAADESGLKKNDKILELNGQNTSQLTARQIEKIIRDSRTDRKLTLLTIDPDGYEYSVRHGIPLHSDLPFVERPRGQRTYEHDHRYTESVAL